MNDDVDMTALQLKLEDRSTTFDEKYVWADDRLGGLNDKSKTLIELVKGQQRPLTICLDGEWGSGKTFFLTRLAHDYNTLEGGTRAIYYNAWQDDFLEDPLLAIICQLEKVIKDGAGSEFIDAIKQAAIPCLASAGLAVVKSVLKNKVGVDIDSIGVDELSTQRERIFERYQEMDASRSTLKNAIAKLAETTWKETQKPLLFIIDELDRCRPTFAIELLERVKHLFSVPHMVFMVGVDLSQLGKSIQAVYGDIDSADYLHRFFDVEMKLPASSKEQFVDRLWEEHGLDRLFKSNELSPHALYDMMAEFKRLIAYRNLTLRQIEKCVRTYALLVASSAKGTCNLPLLAAIAVVLKVTDGDAYEKYIDMRFDLGELLNTLYPKAKYNDYDTEEGIFIPAKMLTNIAFLRSENSASHLKLEGIKQAIAGRKDISFDSVVMPKCFEECAPSQIESFYSYVLNDDQRRLIVRSNIADVLKRMDNGLRLIV